MVVDRGSSVGLDTACVPLTTVPPTSSCSASPLPDGPCLVCPRLAQEFEPWRQAAYWQAMHRRAVQREQLLQQRIQELEARVRLRDHSHLEAVVEEHEVSGDHCRCRGCGRPFVAVSGTEDSTILEIEVRAY